jgi:hypothetical protein
MKGVKGEIGIDSSMSDFGSRILDSAVLRCRISEVGFRTVLLKSGADVAMLRLYRCLCLRQRLEIK